MLNIFCILEDIIIYLMIHFNNCDLCFFFIWLTSTHITQIRLISKLITLSWVFWVSQVFQFLNAKCESAFLAKRNPRQINWTVLYRRKHKKGQSVSNCSLRLGFSVTNVFSLAAGERCAWCWSVLCGVAGLRFAVLASLLMPHLQP